MDPGSGFSTPVPVTSPDPASRVAALRDAMAPAQTQSPHDAALQFEAVLVEQVFKVFRESAESGWMGTGEDSSASSLLGFGEQELAKVIAKAGGFGLSRMIEEGIARQRTSAPVAAIPNALP